MRSRWCTRLDLPVYGHGEVIISCIVHAPGTEVGRRRCVVAGQTPWETRDKRGERAAKSTRRVQHILRRRGRRYQQRKFCGFHITGPAARPGTASSVDSYRSRSAAGHSKFGGLIPVPQSGRAQQVRWFHTGPSERPGTASSVVPLPRGVDYHLSAYETLDGDDGTGDSE